MAIGAGLYSNGNTVGGLAPGAGNLIAFRFNLAAQLLAADLDVVAGAGACATAVGAINDAEALLAGVHFNGISHGKLTSAQATQASSLGATIDRYNNNLLC